MKSLRNNIPMVVMAALAIAAVSSFPPVAKAEEPSRWSVKASMALVDTSTPFSVAKPSGGQLHAGGNAELGATIAIEYRMSRFIGLELAAVYAKSPDIDDTTNGNNDEIGEGPSFLPVIAGANFHLVDTDKLDVYIGPRVAFTKFGDFDLDIDGENASFEVDDEFSWGAAAGINYKFGDSRWSFVAEATYLNVDMEITQRGESTSVVNSFDPLIVNMGASYRF